VNVQVHRRPAWWTSPWLRGPLLLLREPMAAIAVVAATAVLGLVVAAGPLFVSSVGTAALHDAAAKQCRQDNQISVVNASGVTVGAQVAGPQPEAAVAAGDPVVRAAFARAGLPAPLVTRYASVSTGDTSGALPAEVGLFAAPGALEHVRLLSRVPGTGVFLTDTYAARLGLRAGDRLPIARGSLRIAGTYRNLDTASYRTVLPAFWCHWRDLIVTSASSAPPPFVLTDPATLAATPGARIEAEWTSPTDIDSMTVAGARRLAAAGRTLFTAGQLQLTNAESPVAGYAERTQLDFNLQLTTKLQGAVGTPVLAIAAAGAALSLVLVAGAVLFWIQRRRAELTLLAARGVGPAALGLKAVAELALPAAAGCAAGWAGGLGLLPLLGPSTLTEPGAPARALLAAAVSWAATLAVVLLVATLALGEHRIRDHPALRLAPVGAVVALLGVAGWLVHNAGLTRSVLPGVYRIDPALLLAPVLGLTGLVLASALLAAAPLQRARSAARRASVPVFAAVNRTAAARGPLIAVICGLAIPVALAVYAAGFTVSAAATVTAKAQTYTGALVALALRLQVGELPDLAGAATPVSYTLGQATTADPPTTTDGGAGGTEVELLGVDPRTFADYAYPERGLTGTPLPDLLRRLTDRTADGPAAALLVGNWIEPAPTAVQVRSTSLPITVVDRAPAFPGIRYPYRPAIVVNLAAVADLDPFGNWSNELWTDQAHAPTVLAALSQQSVLTDDVQQPATFLDAAGLLPVTWTFQFLQAVAVLVAAVSAAALLLFLSARQQRQQAAYVLMRRMGLTRGTSLRSLLLELGALTGWAWVTGAATGVVALLVATRNIDVDPGYLPPTLLRLPTAVILSTAAGLAVIAAALAAWTQRRSDLAQPAAVLRT
jgi:putative ABC transport system permease protein